MTFDKLEEVLGKDRVQAVQKAVEEAFIASREPGNRQGPAAIKQLLIAMIVATTVTPTESRYSKVRIARCVKQLQELAGATRDQYDRKNAEPPRRAI